ncbi:MAG: putative RNA-binding protein [Streblomastix strix]|uniref:Putative RNA-binding protein n=1 Tax=Streblomastix strix TaxID=222440 RepID=A0A5J4X886_9EUKA|nr:MAG: putative RNA-binding protein [Streblomastix strix]
MEDDEGKGIFVGDLDSEVTEEELVDLFTKFGSVQRATIKKDKYTTNSLGYGFVYFDSAESAQNVLQQNQKQWIHSRPMKIGPAERNTNICVSNLPEDTSENEIRSLFSQFGTITQVEYLPQNRQSFIKYKKRNEAQEARKKMSDEIIRGCQLKIGWADSASLQTSVLLRFNRKWADQMAVDDKSNRQNENSNETQTKHELFNENNIKLQLQKYGEIIRIELPKQEGGNYRGIGFVHFNANASGERV